MPVRSRRCLDDLDLLVRRRPLYRLDRDTGRPSTGPVCTVAVHPDAFRTSFACDRIEVVSVDEPPPTV